MSDKQTRCPHCQTVYKVSVTQLTVAQGMVCCAKCSTQFNALTYLVKQPESEELVKKSTSSSPNDLKTFQKDIFEEKDIIAIFDRKIENSNMDLRTYLNNLNKFNIDPIAAFPALNLSSRSKDRQFDKTSKPRHPAYYVAWFFANVALLFIFVFQLLWFNPSLLAKSPTLNAFFINSCAMFNCVTIDQRYKKMTISHLNTLAIDDHSTEFNGILINNYEKSLNLPLLKLSLIDKGVIKASYIKSSTDYLVPSLNGITRIPTNSPFEFKFAINVSKTSFDNYKIEVIRP
ncbi:DUF3426 domain-containing protein [Acinetobacter sp. 194]|uniref:DUF3426 domain-containing protein n=1 Tax=Acinetobacter shaoyimingii TaxID=2715164 RepID=UPI0014073E7D|nr:DUF3426 domain-containing protein [Acinetobacter shaoyimingii]NHB57121.1 DUF3426 domain-containing protein [Acinetobacter shaoyimingii]